MAQDKSDIGTCLELLMICFLCIVFFVAGCYDGKDIGKVKCRNEAVETGNATYYINDNHEKEFKWGKEGK